jgi:hypothetical protein
VALFYLNIIGALELKNGFFLETPFSFDLNAGTVPALQWTFHHGCKETPE